MPKQKQNRKDKHQRASKKSSSLLVGSSRPKYKTPGPEQLPMPVRRPSTEERSVGSRSSEARLDIDGLKELENEPWNYIDNGNGEEGKDD